MGAGVSEEKRKILEMLASGKITVDEAEKLLGAVSSGIDHGEEGHEKPRYLRVLVEPDTSQPHGDRVNIRVPLKLIRAGLRFASFIPKSAQTKVSEALKAKGIDVDVENIRLEELVEQLNDLSIDVEGKEKVRIYCE
jgi:hypothetical protein